MDATSFDFTVSVPQDARFASMVRRVAEQAAEYAGYPRTQAEAFGQRVEDVVRDSIDQTSADGSLPVVVRRSDGPLEVLIDGRPLTIDR